MLKQGLGDETRRFFLVKVSRVTEIMTQNENFEVGEEDNKKVLGWSDF